MGRRTLRFLLFVVLIGASQAVTNRAHAAHSAYAGKHIVVVLSTQKLYAYTGSAVVWWSYVTTGNRALPTPAGQFAILAKFHPYEFISPWSRSSPYWYPPSRSTYAMEFLRGGYFIHDAPWRSYFGLESNGTGRPGTNFGGTHGCINVPYPTARFLFRWAPVGTPVDVVP